MAASVAASDDAALAELAALPGFGPRTAPWLLAIGIRSAAQLDRLLEPDDGAVSVYRALRASRPGVNLNALWGLEALRLGCSWQDIPSARKAELRALLADG